MSHTTVTGVKNENSKKIDTLKTNIDDLQTVVFNIIKVNYKQLREDTIEREK